MSADAVSADTDAVQVWLIDADLPAAALADLESRLDPAQRQRAAAIPDDRLRRRYLAAHGATRWILAERLGVPAAQLSWQRGPHGKPELAAPAGLRFNLSHSGDLAMLAISDRRAVGVDIQVLADQHDARRLAARYFPPAEARYVAAAPDRAGQVDRFVRLWVRKEACVKASGGRLVPGLALPVAGTAAQLLVADPTGERPEPYLVSDVAVPPGFHAAVALVGAGPYRVTWHRFQPDRFQPDRFWPGSRPGAQPGHESRSERPVLVRKTSSRLGR